MVYFYFQSRRDAMIIAKNSKKKLNPEGVACETYVEMSSP
ncbi:metal-dependent hydrolases of the beta-lactamase superfamily III [Candidatus Brocadia sinica JPN1]|uniref:Metal-dependent hydrolases of the beta-lactamase superfamily III n=1 Tax=Candidatus Brocadia sinica JPN1 TaxID=1197129 RepID=A0ABQ0JX77_9BACT|nr:metal-dependent hydrolases of the beta-lactamase superfamily III [Candidatus Brocadia sinica JPN1]